MKKELLALKERIEAELRDIERTVQRAKGAWKGATRFPDQRDYYFDSLALNLHSFYNGLERIFEVIARQLGPVFPSGERWHRDLLEQMAREIPEARPAVLSAGTVALLDDLWFSVLRGKNQGKIRGDFSAMKKQIRQSMIKDDKSIRKITQQWEQERQRLGIETKPHDFKGRHVVYEVNPSSELWKSGQAFEEVDEAQPEEVIELFATVEGNKLVLKEPAPFPVHGNEIYIDKRKIIITLEE